MNNSVNNSAKKIALCAECSAQITELVGRTDLNGSECRLLSRNQKAKRWVVELTNNEKVLIKPRNLISSRKEDQRKQYDIRPQDVRARLESMGTAVISPDDAIFEYTAIIDLVSSNRKLRRLYKRELSDAYSAHSLQYNLITVMTGRTTTVP